MRLVLIVLATVFVSSAAGAGITGYYLDRQWTGYFEQLSADYERQQIEVEREAEARGYWRAMYTMCYILLYGDTIKCARGARDGYKEGNHLQPPPPGWDWFFIKYQGQMQ